MRSLRTVSFAAIAAITLTACDSSNDGIQAPTGVPLQIIHAVSDAPAVNVSAGGAQLVAGLDFKETTSVFRTTAGTVSVAVDAIVPGGLLRVVDPTDLTLVDGNTYSVVAIGSAGTAITPLVLENEEAAIGAGNLRVQVVHGAFNAPAVDIHVTRPSDPIVPANAIAGGSTPFGAASDQIEVPAGDYRIRVTAPGDTTPLFDSGTLGLPVGADLVVVAVDNTVAGNDLPDAPPITLFVSDSGAGLGNFEVIDQATPSQIRVVHAVPDANGVDIYVNDAMAMGMPAIEDLDYTDVIVGPDQYLTFEPGTVNLLVTGANNPGFIAIPATDVEFSAGQQYTIYATGTVAGGIAPFVTADDDRSILTEAKTRIIHLAPSAGLVDIYVTAPMTDITDIDPTLISVGFRADTGYLSLLPGSYDVTVTLAGTKTIAIGPAPFMLDAGGVYTAVAIDPDVDVANDPFDAILLDDF